MPEDRRPAIALALVAALIVAACAAPGASAPAAGSPPARELFKETGLGYSMASRYGDLVWTAGHLPTMANPTDPFETKVEVLLDDLEATLEAAGAGFDTVLKTNVYLLSMEDWETFNEVYVRRVGATGLPPRTTVQVAALGFGSPIEIEMVAHVRAQ
jgi:enamine deaminase RidA (YjgF/YER057c/UK114 family)